jgi:hypothetical protein
MATKLLLLALVVTLASNCGRLGISTPSSTAVSTSATNTSNNQGLDGSKVGVNFRVDPALSPTINALALTSGSVVLDGIDHAIVNVLGCPNIRYNREKELHIPAQSPSGTVPFIFHDFSVAIQSGVDNASCFIALDILQIAFDLNNGTTRTETYLRDVVTAPQPSALNRGAGDLVFVNRTPSGSRVGPQKLYVSVAVANWPDSPGSADSNSALTYTLKAFSAISNDRDLSTIIVDSAVISGSNSISIGQSVNMPINLLTIGSTDNSTPGSIDRGTASANGSYAFELWCTVGGGGSGCGDMTATNSAFCAIPDVSPAVFDATTLVEQCPALVGGAAAPYSVTSAQNAAIAAFTTRVSAESGLVNNLISSSSRLDNFWDSGSGTSKIPSNTSQGFWFIVRTDTADGTGFKYWHITQIPGASLPLTSAIPLALVGADYVIGGSLLLTSAEGGSNWNRISSVANGDLSTVGNLQAASCSEQGSSAACVAVGIPASVPNVIINSNDAGASWTYRPITGILDPVNLATTSCTGSGASSVCVAGGFSGGSGINAFITTSSDGGTTWSIPSLSLPTNSVFRGSSCTGSGTSAICIAAGDDTSLGPPSAPLLSLSSDGGGTWSIINSRGSPGVNIPIDGAFHHASCTGSGLTALCIAVGTDYSAALPLINQSSDGGSTWSTINVPNIAATGTQGVFYGASCTGSGSSAICAAVGDDTELSPTTAKPILAVTVDGGATWVKKTSGLPTTGVLRSVSCSGSGATAVCVAVGFKNPGEAPLIIQSTDGGVTWSEPTAAAGLTTSGEFSSVSCRGEGVTAICVAGGEDYSGTQPPMYVQTIDGGSTWTIPSLSSGSLPTVGTIFGSAAGK